jgi:hypothetical protein
MAIQPWMQRGQQPTRAPPHRLKGFGWLSRMQNILDKNMLLSQLEIFVVKALLINNAFFLWMNIVFTVIVEKYALYSNVRISSKIKNSVSFSYYPIFNKWFSIVIS